MIPFNINKYINNILTPVITADGKKVTILKCHKNSTEIPAIEGFIGNDFEYLKFWSEEGHYKDSKDEEKHLDLYFEGFYKLIPFNLKLAKTPTNPEGLEVYTKNYLSVEILKTDRSSTLYPLVVLLNNTKILTATQTGETKTGNEILCLKEALSSTRRMTWKELAKWLREKPEEFREAKINENISCGIVYKESFENEEVGKAVMVRSINSDWKEPFIDLK